VAGLKAGKSGGRKIRTLECAGCGTQRKAHASEGGRFEDFLIIGV